MPVTFFAGRTATHLHIIYNMETTVETKETAIDQLRSMNVGDVLEFPAERSPYLRNLVSQRLIGERLEGKAWSVNLNMEQGTTIVTRTA